MRKIAVITGTRAEYGLLYWIIKKIHEDPDLDLQLIVTAMHLSSEFGNTYIEIEKDGFPITDKVDMEIKSDKEYGISKSMGIGLSGFAKSYKRLKPDLLLVLGDRFEILSAVAAAIPFRIPVAHIHGGESTEGLIDELIRHAVTKMSHIHFTATEKYRQRIIQMGENPENIFCFGAPGIDNIYYLKLLNNKELRKELKIPENIKIGIVTYHPVTLENNTGKDQIVEILSTLPLFKDIFWVFTLPNADTGGRIIAEIIHNFTSANPKRSKLFHSLGQIKYLSLMKHADLMVGNSSSGIIEAPSFKLPCVNIGDRQKGRIRTGNVIDVPESKKDKIQIAIKKALSEKFRKSLQNISNPYGEGGTSNLIIEILKKIDINESLLKKRFYDLR